MSASVPRVAGENGAYLLEEGECRRLLAAAQAGDAAARETLTECNLRLVHAMVRRFIHSGCDPEDLFQIGCIGLLKAIDRFDLSYDVKFSTFAVPLILGEIKRFLRDDGPVKLSRSIKEMAYRVSRAMEDYRREYGREPVLGDLAAKLGLTREEIVAALEACRPPLSLQEKIFEDDGDPVYLHERVKSEDKVLGQWIDTVSLRQVLSRLDARQRNILIQRFFQSKTQAEVAAAVGVSQVQISRLERQALAQLRQMLADTV